MKVVSLWKYEQRLHGDSKKVGKRGGKNSRVGMAMWVEDNRGTEWRGEERIRRSETRGTGEEAPRNGKRGNGQTKGGAERSVDKGNLLGYERGGY